MLDVKGDDEVTVTGITKAIYMWFLRSYTEPVVGGAIDFTKQSTTPLKRYKNESLIGNISLTLSESRSTISYVNEMDSVSVLIPSDVKYLLVSTKILGNENHIGVLINGKDRKIEEGYKSVIKNLIDVQPIIITNPIVSSYLNNVRYSENETDNSKNVYSREDVSIYYNGERADNSLPYTVSIKEVEGASAYKIKIAENPNFVDSISVSAIPSTNEITWLKVNRHYWVRTIAVVGGNEEIIDTYHIRTKGLRRLNPLKSVANLRDLGNQHTTDGRRIKQGRIFRSGDLGGLSVSDINTLENVLKIRLVCGLAADAEDDGKFSSSVETFHPYNLGQWSEILMSTWVSLIRRYSVYLRKIITALKEGKNVLYHCNGGADRTGLMSAIIEGLCGVSENNICMDYELTSFSIFSGHNLSRTRMGEKQEDGSYRILSFGSGIKFVKTVFSGQTFKDKWTNMLTDQSLAITAGVDDDFPEGFTPLSLDEIEVLRESILEDI